jgi:mono/diheme cytochrome c family protein
MLSLKSSLAGTASRLCAILICVAFAACRQDMHDQPKYKPYRPSSIFEDGTSARPIVENTVPRGLLRDDPSGQKAAPDQMRAARMSDVTEFPFVITQEALDRGQERFNIFCSPCHGRLGDGDGMIARRGFRRPPSFHIDRLREAPLGHFFDVITNGFGAMPDYASQVPPDDRWKIIAYIRALQLSQRATLADVPPEDRGKLETGGKQ